MSKPSNSSAMRSFHSSDFVFRPTSLGQRMAEAGLVSSPHLVREPLLEVINGDGKHRVISRKAA